MIDNTVESKIVNSLQNHLLSKSINCPVIASNQTAPIPEYPYISYTITSPIISDNKGFSIADNGDRYKPFTQIWSFTIQSSSDEESMQVALHAYDWFAEIGNEYLSDNDIVVRGVGSISNRDNLITIEYEYRKGFDVTFLLMNVISVTDISDGSIEHVEISGNADGINTHIEVNKED